MFHVSSVPLAEKILGQSMFLRWDLSPEMSALLQFGLVGLSVFFAILIFSSIFKMQWSLLPILPSSVIEMNLSWQFVIIRSSMLPFIWVGKSTSWARPSSSFVSRTFLPRDVELSSSQLSLESTVNHCHATCVPSCHFCLEISISYFLKIVNCTQL